MPVVYEALLQRLTERESLLNLRQQVRNQLHALRHRTPIVAVVEARLVSLLETFQAQVDTIDREIEELFREFVKPEKRCVLETVQAGVLLQRFKALSDLSTARQLAGFVWAWALAFFVLNDFIKIYFTWPIFNDYIIELNLLFTYELSLNNIFHSDNLPNLKMYNCLKLNLL